MGQRLSPAWHEGTRKGLIAVDKESQLCNARVALTIETGTHTSRSNGNTTTVEVERYIEKGWYLLGLTLVRNQESGKNQIQRSVDVGCPRTTDVPA